MKKIIMCDANFSVLPILKAIKKKNYHLTVVGKLLSDPCHLLADHSLQLDYSNIAALLQYTQENEYSGIVPGCNDQSYISSSWVAEKLNLPGFDSFETSLIIHHKDKFRTFAEKNNYPIPKAVYKIEDVHKLNFPVLIKPIDSFSGKGINKAYNMDDVKVFWDQAKNYSKEGCVIAEEFIEGDLYSHSAFIKNKKIIADFFVNEYCTVYPYQVNSSNVSTQLPEKIKTLLREWLDSFSNDLHLCDGLVHTQFLVNSDNIYLIEVARRSPGDLYSQLIEKSTGVNYAELYSLPFCHVELPSKINIKESKYISRHTVSTNKDCVFIGSTINVKSIQTQSISLKYTGEFMKAAPFGKSGLYFIEHKNSLLMESITPKLKNFIDIETQ
ncbi:ATP-grasp domain-containing protein [Colwellia echini]|uniref:ATP-grasp domain-containing protein n=1 Tax=Colwellia echini TaxID=1982103 RepID=A0ABY3MWL6_9GAMM|nr:ATP-grasp domain-containing protein [Colwellia echini]TYK65590.1 ATP-grasp domain-containing protein [Colwellia echini]